MWYGERRVVDGVSSSPEMSARIHRRERARGVVALEFVLCLIVALSVFAIAGEWLRISLFDQTLARVTHESARAVARLADDDITRCHAEVMNAVQGDAWASWLFDTDGLDGVDVSFDDTTGWPDVDDEMQVGISWDVDPADGVDDWVTSRAGCGGDGSWLRVRSQVVVVPWFGPFRAIRPDGFQVRHESWGRNNRR